MNILVACEESQRVATAFRELGHNAFSCDIVPCSGGHPEYHIQDDVLSILEPLEIRSYYNFLNRRCIPFVTQSGVFHIVDKWDMLIAFPPCTFLSRAGACNIPRCPDRIEKGFAAREFFMRLYTCDIERIAIENPIPMARFNLPTPSMRFQPYEFGDNFSKYTYLWLKNLPPLLPTVNYDRAYKFPSWCAVHQSGTKDRAKIRSTTFPGVARAMAQQWG